MSILIRGMNAPKSCFDCKYITLFEKLGENRCSLLSWAVIEDGAHSRLSDCPIKELPAQHGDLIDADALVYDEYEKTWLVHSAPTIIEAEGTEV